MIGMLTIIPFIIEQFSQSYVLTPVLTFFVTFGFLMIHCVAIQLEAPFGEDASDLPLLEMHTSFNSSMLVFAAIEGVEEECDEIFQRQLDAKVLVVVLARQAGQALAGSFSRRIDAEFCNQSLN